MVITYDQLKAKLDSLLLSGKEKIEFSKFNYPVSQRYNVGNIFLERIKVSTWFLWWKEHTYKYDLEVWFGVHLYMSNEDAILAWIFLEDAYRVQQHKRQIEREQKAVDFILNAK